MVFSIMMRSLGQYSTELCKYPPPDYYVRAKEWHNIAAELATTQSHHGPQHAWRHYQLLHMQHFTKQSIDEQDTLFGVHLGNRCHKKEYRGKDNITYHSIWYFLTRVWDQGGVRGDVTTFPAREMILKKTFPDNAKPVDSRM